MDGLRPAEAEVGLLPASASGDVMLVDGLTALVNQVYAIAEKGLWLDGVASRSTGLRFGTHSTVRSSRPLRH